MYLMLAAIIRKPLSRRGAEPLRRGGGALGRFSVARVFVQSFIESINPSYVLESPDRKNGKPPIDAEATNTGTAQALIGCEKISAAVSLTARVVTSVFSEGSYLGWCAAWVVTLSACAGVAAASVPTINIFNTKDFSRICNDPDYPSYANYQQMASFTAVDISPVCSKRTPFIGHYDGGCHTITGPTDCLFDQVGKGDRGGVIEMINIRLGKYHTRVYNSAYGIISCESEKASIRFNRVEQTQFQDSSNSGHSGYLSAVSLDGEFRGNIIDNCTFDFTGTYKVAGFIVGGGRNNSISENTIINSLIKMDFPLQSRAGYLTENRAGVLTGSSLSSRVQNNKIINCIFKLQGTTDSTSAGIFSGFSENDILTDNQIISCRVESILQPNAVAQYQFGINIDIGVNRRTTITGTKICNSSLTVAGNTQIYNQDCAEIDPVFLEPDYSRLMTSLQCNPNASQPTTMPAAHTVPRPTTPATHNATLPPTTTVPVTGTTLPPAGAPISPGNIVGLTLGCALVAVPIGYTVYTLAQGYRQGKRGRELGRWAWNRFAQQTRSAQAAIHQRIQRLRHGPQPVPTQPPEPVDQNTPPGSSSAEVIALSAVNTSTLPTVVAVGGSNQDSDHSSWVLVKRTPQPPSEMNSQSINAAELQAMLAIDDETQDAAQIVRYHRSPNADIEVLLPGNIRMAFPQDQLATFVQTVMRETDRKAKT
ncbi:hypothetical protein [Endozoicomonas sp.]|uniref:hypothetical protein n=1 Tax=Endozoicomonas sp. TaxID=1892382 RepID=UPI00383B3BB8